MKKNKQTEFNYTVAHIKWVYENFCFLWDCIERHKKDPWIGMEPFTCNHCQNFIHSVQETYNSGRYYPIQFLEIFKQKTRKFAWKKFLEYIKRDEKSGYLKHGKLNTEKKEWEYSEYI